MSNHWNEPKIGIGCELDPCTEDPTQCLSDALDKATDDAYDRMRDERDERDNRSCPR